MTLLSFRRKLCKHIIVKIMEFVLLGLSCILSKTSLNFLPRMPKAFSLTLRALETLYLNVSYPLPSVITNMDASGRFSSITWSRMIGGRSSSVEVCSVFCCCGFEPAFLIFSTDFIIYKLHEIRAKN